MLPGLHNANMVSQACGLFQIVMRVFNALAGEAKLLVVDEAHRFINSSLAESLREVAAGHRHRGMRLAICTQDPRGVPAELMQLCSAVALFNLDSPAWYAHVSANKRTSEAAADGMDVAAELAQLPVGQCLLYQSRTATGDDLLRLSVRPRTGLDLGGSVIV
jgi:DNA helicase HerA-like ATPase